MFEDDDKTGINLSENKYITSDEIKCLSFNNKFGFTILNINLRSLTNTVQQISGQKKGQAT